MNISKRLVLALVALLVASLASQVEADNDFDCMEITSSKYPTKTQFELSEMCSECCFNNGVKLGQISAGKCGCKLLKDAQSQGLTAKVKKSLDPERLAKKLNARAIDRERFLMGL